MKTRNESFVITFRIAIFAAVLIPIFLVSVSDAYSAATSDQAKQTAQAKQAAEQSEQASHKTPSLNPLELASDTAIWSLVIFLLVFGILGKFAFKPIAKALDDRESNIAEKISSAQRTNEEAKEILNQYQSKMDQSKEEVRQILDAARKDAERVAAEIVSKARESAIQERERAMKEIDGATTFALQKIAEQSATLATNLAGKIIHAEIKPEHHRDLIRGALDEFTIKS
ncbi:MAG: F0F1 ATP synthase subunit B [Planctomycetaceae bacterium]|jgi:F-type H+-transporting ATPase subunit b|nr:F0F1 ATP synthase subunit B [Planctomycetaceae bacterium]